MICRLPLLLLSSASPLAAAAGDADSILANEFCQNYYSGTGDCAALRAAVRANHSRTLPTLELGDPAAPPMYFLHGWPDTGALWANQFEYFCAPPHGTYFCVAPTWFDFHPDIPMRPESDLFWDKQVAAFHAVAEETGMANITLVIFDFGAALGYQFTYKYPHLVSKVVAMDIGNNPTPGGATPAGGMAALPYLPQYQQNNINSFLTGNDQLMRGNIVGTPCAQCNGFTSKTGWPYYQIVRNASGEEWHARMATGVPLSKWEFTQTPSFPDIPILFLYGNCDIGTGCKGCPACKKRSMYFFNQAYLDWLKARGDSSKSVVIPGVGHWMQCRQAEETNKEMAAWL